MSLTNLTSDITYPLIFKNGDYNKIIQIISERVNGFGSKICFSKQNLEDLETSNQIKGMTR